MTLHSLLKAGRRRQVELATHLGVSEPSVSRWVARRADIPAKHIRPIAEFLGVSALDVLAVATVIETAGEAASERAEPAASSEAA